MTYYFRSPADDPGTPLDADDELRLAEDAEAAGESLELNALEWDVTDDWDAPDDDFEYVALEHSELDRRLRNLVWPAPPPEVRQRCFEAVLQAGLLGACPPAPPVYPERPTGRRRTRRAEQVQRYEVTRRRFDTLGTRALTAPRREPRFASVL